MTDETKTIKCWNCHLPTMKVRERGDCYECTDCGATENIGKPLPSNRPKKV